MNLFFISSAKWTLKHLQKNQKKMKQLCVQPLYSNIWSYIPPSVY